MFILTFTSILNKKIFNKLLTTCADFITTMMLNIIIFLQIKIKDSCIGYIDCISVKIVKNTIIKNWFCGSCSGNWKSKENCHGEGNCCSNACVVFI